jgi:hypothetical protein
LAVAGRAQSAPAQSDKQAAIDRGLAFLVKDALAWKEKHKCASCHHAALTIWALHEAKERGHQVDEPVLAELTKWIAQSGEGKTGVPRPEGIPRAHNTKAVFFALGLAAEPKPDAVSQEGFKKMLTTVKGDQIEDGCWHAWTDTRPPMFGHSDETATACATIALLPQAAAGDESAVQARDRALAWLRGHETTGDHQAVAMRLVLYRRAGLPAADWQPLDKRLLDSQHTDGGWRQTQEMASDPYATGQALYALSHAGRGADDPAVARGVAWLVKSQLESGSWTMTSRPSKPGAEAAKNLVPITGAGNAWAILGLVRASQ